MSRFILLCLAAFLLIGSVTAADLPFVFGEETPPLAGLSPAELQDLAVASPELEGLPAISQVPENELMEWTDVGGTTVASGATKSTAGELKAIFNSRVEPGNELVHDTVMMVVGSYTGSFSLYQVCAIYNYLNSGDDSTSGWSYYPDPRGVDLYYYANKTLANGQKMLASGAGDCDDFAILMASLVESIGGTTRIILAYNQSVGHAYTEVYLGSVNEPGSQVEDVIEALKEHYGVSEVFTHLDTTSGEVWLNLDWWPDGGVLHPGGPFFPGTKHIPLRIRDQYGKTPMRPPEGFQRNEAPWVRGLYPSFSSPQESGSIITWTAEAVDPDGDRLLYRFALSSKAVDGSYDALEISNWAESNIWTWDTSTHGPGEYRLEVRIRDGKHSGPDDFDDFIASKDFIIQEPTQMIAMLPLKHEDTLNIINNLNGIIYSNIEPSNPIVHDKALEVASSAPGPLNIEQICLIFEYLRDGWRYIPDPRGTEFYGSASETLQLGEAIGSSGAGDCDDFAILIASMIESIGGNVRIILAYNQSVSRTYAEVYLGTLDAADQEVEDIAIWLRARYSTEDIFMHINQSNNEVWLNLDYGWEDAGAPHPGGPFFRCDQQVIGSSMNHEQFGKTPVGLPNG